MISMEVSTKRGQLQGEAKKRCAHRWGSLRSPPAYEDSLRRAPYEASSFRSPSSSSTATPSSRALSSLLPASAPATT